MIRSRKYLDAAKDQACVCCGRRDGTVVACHYQGLRAQALGKGTGIKPHDIAVAWLCSTCHAKFDQYKMSIQEYGDQWVKKLDHSEEFLFQILRTIIASIQQGHLVFKE